MTDREPGAPPDALALARIALRRDLPAHIDTRRQTFDGAANKAIQAWPARFEEQALVQQVERRNTGVARHTQLRWSTVTDCRTRFVPHPCMPGFGGMNRYGVTALTRVTSA